MLARSTASGMLKPKMGASGFEPDDRSGRVGQVVIEHVPEAGFAKPNARPTPCALAVAPGFKALGLPAATYA